MSKFWTLRTFAAAAVLIAAVTRVVTQDKIADAIDATFLQFIVVALLIIVIPWERLKSFKAGGVEVTLERENIKAAIEGLRLDRIEDEELRKKLSDLDDKLSLVQGARVLWIDDKPHNILGIRRLLRSLGIEITSAISSEAALEILNADNDFDLIVTDVQRRGDSYKEVEGGVEIHEGVNFVVILRKHKDLNIKELPVIFYAAYDWERLVKFTRPARELLPEPEISNSVGGFVPKLINCLVEERRQPIKYSAIKKPTSVA